MNIDDRTTEGTITYKIRILSAQYLIVMVVLVSDGTRNLEDGPVTSLKQKKGLESGF